MVKVNEIREGTDYLLREQAVKTSGGKKRLQVKVNLATKLDRGTGRLLLDQS